MSTPPTVLHLRSTGELLGAESVLLEITRRNDAKRFRPILGILHDTRDPYPELARRAESEGLEYQVFRCRKRLDFSAIRQIRAFLASIDASIVHCHGYREDIYGYFASLGKRLSLVGTNHNWIRSNNALRIYARIDGYVLRRFQHVVAVSAPIMDELLAAGLRPENCSLIRNGISVELFENDLSPEPRSPAASPMATAGHPQLGIIASLTPEKGHALLLLAFEKLRIEFPTLGLIIIGDGPLRKSLEREVDRAGLQSCVLFAGTRRDIAHLLSAIDVFVLPSLREGLPMALLEAMAAARPVVTTRVGDIPVVVDDGISGVLIDPGDADAIAFGVARVLNLPDRGAALGKAARAVVKEKYSSRAMADAYMDLYDRLGS